MSRSSNTSIRWSSDKQCLVASYCYNFTTHFVSVIPTECGGLRFVQILRYIMIALRWT